MIHQIDIHKCLLLYKEDNGPGKHEQEIIWSVINGKKEKKKGEKKKVLSRRKDCDDQLIGLSPGSSNFWESDYPQRAAGWA